MGKLALPQNAIKIAFFSLMLFHIKHFEMQLHNQIT